MDSIPPNDRGFDDSLLNESSKAPPDSNF